MYCSRAISLRYRLMKTHDYSASVLCAMAQLSAEAYHACAQSRPPRERSELTRSSLLLGPKVELRYIGMTEPEPSFKPVSIPKTHPFYKPNTKLKYFPRLETPSQPKLMRQSIRDDVPIAMLRHFSTLLHGHLNEWTAAYDIKEGKPEAYRIIVDWMYATCDSEGTTTPELPHGLSFCKIGQLYDAASHLAVPAMLPCIVEQLNALSNKLLDFSEVTRAYSIFPHGHLARQRASYSIARGIIAAWQTRNHHLMADVDDFLQLDEAICIDVHGHIAAICQRESYPSDVFRRIGATREKPEPAMRAKAATVPIATTSNERENERARDKQKDPPRNMPGAWYAA